MIPTTEQTAVRLLAELKHLGIELQIKGNRLRYRPCERMTPALLKRLRASKSELLAILQAAGRVGKDVSSIKAAVQTWPEDRRAEWEERAAIMQFDGRLSKAEAERMSFENLRIQKGTCHLNRLTSGT